MESDFKYLSTFHTKCLRNILKIFRLQIISNKQLFRTTGQDTMNNILATSRWRWVGHVLRKIDDSISKTTQRWTHVVKKTWSTQTNVEEDSRKIIGTTTFELGSGWKASCRQDKVEDPCFCPMCQWARSGLSSNYLAA